MVNKLSESKCKDCCLLPLRLLIKMPHCTGSFINSSREYSLFFPFIFLLFLSQFLTRDKCSLNLQSWWKYFFPAFDVEIFQWFWKFKQISQTQFFFFFSFFAKPGTHSFSDRILSGCLVIPPLYMPELNSQLSQCCIMVVKLFYKKYCLLWF